jgi:hypothetical protein
MSGGESHPLTTKPDRVNSSAADAAPLKILYASGLSANDSSLYRVWALERLGHRVIRFDSNQYRHKNRLLNRIAFHLSAGPQFEKLNRDLLRLARAERADILWADKVLQLQPRTLKELRSMGVVTVGYMPDNPFGTRRDPGWRLYLKSIPWFDLHVVPRERNIAEYKARGAKDVMTVQFAYEPTIHFPPPEGWSDANRDREVSFIGTPYDERAEFLTKLWRDYGVQVTISGTERFWRKALPADAFTALFRDGELYLREYREGIWRSKINLSFLTHSNQDEFAHKSFEIAGCGSFLLAERSPGHSARFKEDEEAVFFSTIEECAEKIRRWLPDEAGRARIAAQGAARAKASGYHNDAQVAAILRRLEGIIPRAGERATRT